MASPSVQPGILSAAVGAAACASGATGPPKSPTTPEDNYRFYQCVFESLYPQHVTCKTIDKSEIHTITPSITTQIIPIDKWVPSVADRAIIRWRIFEKNKVNFE